jgi:phytoene dehydrogenase-like protein
VVEARDVIGGACVTEEVWPGQRVSRGSYVVSMLQPKVVADLELRKFGYDPIPLDPEFATFAADGRPILLPNDEKIAYEQVARVSRKDAEALAPFNALFEKAARFLKPLMLKPPPASGRARTRRAPRTTSCTTRSARSTACRARGATSAAGWARSRRPSPPAPGPPAPRSAPARRSHRSTSRAAASPA